MTSRSSLRAWIPEPALRLYRRIWRWNQKRREKERTPREVFSAIYERGLWGESLDDLSSGGGTINEKYVVPYAELVLRVVDELGAARTRLVDLGCGDFVVGQRLLEELGDRVDYLGVDVVPRLIDRNRERFGAPAVQFACVDIIAEPLPEGDVCLVRQVFQHLSNEQIACVLEKLSQYPLVLVTEHQPTDLASATPNLDKVHGFDTRMGRKSGVFLEHPPLFGRCEPFRARARGGLQRLRRAGRSGRRANLRPAARLIRRVVEERDDLGLAHLERRCARELVH
jgi:SAM-dependent methyltransferase